MGLGTLGSMTLGPETRDSGTWDLGPWNCMCVENVGAQTQKRNLGIFSSHFCVKSRLTLSPVHIFVAFFTYTGKVVAK